MALVGIKAKLIVKLLRQEVLDAIKERIELLGIKDLVFQGVVDLIEGIRAIVDEKLIGGEFLFAIGDDGADAIAERNKEGFGVGLVEHGMDLALADDDGGRIGLGMDKAADEIEDQDQQHNAA